MANLNLKFLRGLQASLPTTGTDGYFYLTTDTHRLYTSVDGKVVPVNEGVVTVANIAALNDITANAGEFFYATEENVLCVFNGKNFIQINAQKTLAELGGVSQTAYDEKMTALEKADSDNSSAISGVDARLQVAEEKLKSVATTEGLGDLTDRVTAAEGEIDALQADSHTHNFADSDVEDAIAKKHAHTFTDVDVEDAISKKHAHTFVESELNKIAAGDVAKWNGVVADHLVAADKTELADSIGDVNTALENYKTSNNEALAGVKATADAAATKEYADAELAKKVAKADYEADKATFATKTELNGVDAKFAQYNTTTAQKAIDDAQDAEIAKKADAEAMTTALAGKVDKVEGKSLIADSEIARLADVHNYDDTQVKADIAKKADSATMTTELGKKVDKVEGYSLVADTEIARLADVDNYDDEEVRGLIGDNAKAIEDLEKYVGTIPAGATATDIVGYVQEKTAGIATEGAMTELGNRVTAVEGDVATIKGDYLKAADIANFETKENVKKVADDLAAYVESNDEALAGVKAIAEAARTEDEVNGQIDAKITALNLGATYEPIGAETRAKAYADGLISDANLGQYTTEQEVKDIVDGVIASAVDGDTITGLANLVEYLNTHGTEAKEMGAAIDVLEGDVKGLKEAPSAGIKASDIEAWNGEIGAKALAETKLDASTFTEYNNAHASDYTNKQIDDAIDADVKAAIDAEVLRANGAYDAKGAAADAQAAAEATAAGALASARTEITAEIGTAISGEVSRADGKYEEKGVAQGIVDALKLGETYEPIGAESRAIAAAEGKVNALAGNVYTKAEVYTKTEVENLMSWGSF